MKNDVGGRARRFVGAAVALLTLAVVIPVGLIAISMTRFGSAFPLAGVAPPWKWSGSDVGRALTNPLSDDAIIDLLVRSSLGIIWVATVLVIISTSAEVIHMIRHRGIPAPSVHGLDWAQRTARFIAAGLLVMVPLAAPQATLATSGPNGHDNHESAAANGHASEEVDLTEPRAAVPRHVAFDEPTSSATASTAPNVHIVHPGESVYSIAAEIADRRGAHVIDVADAILELNLGTVMANGQRFTTPAYIEVGWELTIPDRLVAAAPVEAAQVEAAPAEPGMVSPYTVEPGDTLWSIAEETSGDGAAWSQIWEQNADRTMNDGQTFDDPNLILPGWQLDVRPTPDRPVETAEQDATTDPEPANDESSPIPTTAIPANSLPATSLPTTAIPATSSASTSVPDAPATSAPAVARAPSSSTPGSDSTTTSTTASSSTTTTTAAGLGTDDPAGQDQNEESSGAPSPIRLENAALLAAGILALVAVRRRQRLRASMPRSRVPEPPASVMATERSLRSIDAGERAMRVDVACRAAASLIIESDAQIGWVRVTPDGEIALRLSAPTGLPPPWKGAEQDWTLEAGVPIEMLSEAARRVNLPSLAFVQLGVTDAGHEILVDLEACGVLAVESSPTQADEVVTALTTGLASSLYAEVAHLITVSLPDDALLGHRNAHRTATVDAAFELAVSLVGSTLTHDQTSFALRSLRTGGEVWEPAVVLLASADADDDLLLQRELPAPGHGLAVVAATGESGLASADTRLIGNRAGWMLHAFGSSISLTPLGITPSQLGDVVDVVADADAPLEPFQSPTPDDSADKSSVLADLGSTESESDATETPAKTPADAPFEPLPHEIVVRLVGAVDVTDCNLMPCHFERSKTVELIAWLATHRDRATRTGARTALWEMDVRDATFANVVSEARRGLGRAVTPPDGEEWLERTLTEQLPIHELVVTDAQLMQQRLDISVLEPPARALEILRPAVEMIRDAPFSGTSYLWPDAEGITSNLVLLSISASAEFAAHALSLGNTDDVFWATGQGLRVLPGHEELIGLRMRAHARAGDLAGVRQEWEAYERILVADAWSDGEPAPKLLALRHELLTSL